WSRIVFFVSSRRRHTSFSRDWSSDVCSSDLFGHATAYPHGVPGVQHLRRGELVLIDTGCSVQGYNSDITRTFIFGTPDADQQRKIGRASCRERGSISVGAGALAEEGDESGDV